MTHILSTAMIGQLKTNDYVVKTQFKGLTDDDLLLQPESRGNCANWVLGHIVYGRSNILVCLGEEPNWGDEEGAMYAFGSPAITGADSPHLSMEQLIAVFDATQAQIITKLEATSDAEMDKPFRDSTVGQNLSFLVWHESYHAGQFEYLRQLTGVNDKVI